MRSSRLSVRFPATVISLALTLGVVAFVAAPASAGAMWKVAASSKSTGQYSLADVNTDQMNSGLQSDLTIARQTAELRQSGTLNRKGKHSLRTSVQRGD